MKIGPGLHLSYCTNIHRGETWEEVFAALRTHALAVRDQVCSSGPFAIGLRVGAVAAGELREPGNLTAFRRWLDRENCYVVAINGFPYGRFHGTRVKEQVYAPDWSTDERLEYTKLLFDLLDAVAPAGESIGVSTLPGSFKEFAAGDAWMERIRDRLWCCCRHIEALRERSGRDIHLGLEPEPLGLFETSAETVEFLETLLDRAEDPEMVRRNVGINYDTCHLAVEYETAREAVGRFRQAGLRLSKLHLSSALRLVPTPEALDRLRAFEEGVYLHQVVIRNGKAPGGGGLVRFRDLGPALAAVAGGEVPPGDEWRVHFHIPLHEAPEPPFGDTRDHLLEILDLVREDPALCPHLEMETYTWEVLPAGLRERDVAAQLVGEYGWTLGALRERGLA
jgi:sugar phosphate isomerase/epimerase